MLWTIIRKARNHCQDVDNCGDEDHCQYHLGIDHCHTGNAVRIESTVRMEILAELISIKLFFTFKKHTYTING